MDRTDEIGMEDEDGGESDDTGDDPVDGVIDHPDIHESARVAEWVFATQISYSKGLVQSGARAEQAMRAEIQGFLDKMLFLPRHYCVRSLWIVGTRF
jgi:hypothetical protein